MVHGNAHRAEVRRLSVEEAAPVLGVSVYMVRSLIRQRRVPFYRVGRRIVLDQEDLERFLRAHRVEAREIQLEPPRGKTTTLANSTGVETRPPRPRGERPGIPSGGAHP